MARKKAKRRRRKKYMSVYDLGVAYGNLSILSYGALGTSPIGWVTGQYDLASKTSGVYDSFGGGFGNYGVTSGTQTTISGADAISLRDMLNEPALAFDQITSNVKNHAVGMAVNAVIFNVGAGILKKAMRQPIRNANKLIRPLGMGVQI